MATWASVKRDINQLSRTIMLAVRPATSCEGLAENAPSGVVRAREGWTARASR
jgi:hypothetical protein